MSSIITEKVLDAEREQVDNAQEATKRERTGRDGVIFAVLGFTKHHTRRCAQDHAGLAHMLRV